MICNKCKEEKEIKEFNIDRHNKDGLKKTCKKCCNERIIIWCKKNGWSIVEYNRKRRLSLSKKHNVPVSAIVHHGLNVAIAVFDKFNRKCDICGTTERLAIHHIDGKGRNYTDKGLKPNNNLNNLQLLCIKCHGSIHGIVGGILSGIARRKNKMV